MSIAVRWHSTTSPAGIPGQQASRTLHDPVDASPKHAPDSSRFTSSLSQTLSMAASIVSSQLVSLAAPACEQQALSFAHAPGGPPVGTQAAAAAAGTRKASAARRRTDGDPG